MTSCSDVELFSSMIMICESISLAVSATLRPRFVDTLLLSLDNVVAAVVVVAAPDAGVTVSPAVGVTEVVDAFSAFEWSLSGLCKG